MENKHKQYMKALALHNSHRYIDRGRLHLFSDLLFWVLHQINSLNNLQCDCGGGRFFRVGCHTGVEPQAWMCSKDGNVCYVCLAVQYNFARSKEVTVHLKRLFLSYGSWNCLDGRLKNSEKISISVFISKSHRYVLLLTGHVTLLLKCLSSVCSHVRRKQGKH